MEEKENYISCLAAIPFAASAHTTIHPLLSSSFFVPFLATPREPGFYEIQPPLFLLPGTTLSRVFAGNLHAVNDRTPARETLARRRE